MVVETASFRNLVNFEIVDIARQQKLLSAVDARIVEELQRRDAFLLDKLSSYIVFRQFEFSVDGIYVEVGVGIVFDDCVGNRFDMVAGLKRTVELHYKAEYKVCKRHYNVGRTRLRLREVAETHIHRSVQVFLLVVLDDYRAFEVGRPTRYGHMYILKTALRRIAVQSVGGYDDDLVLSIIERFSALESNSARTVGAVYNLPEIVLVLFDVVRLHILAYVIDDWHNIPPPLRFCVDDRYIINHQTYFVHNFDAKIVLFFLNDHIIIIIDCENV